MAAPIYWVALWFLDPPRFFDLTWPLQRPLLAALLMAVYPVLEEIAFRGVLQAALLRLALFSRGWAGISRANLITSALFAALHVVTQNDPLAAAVVLPSLLLGVLFERHRSVPLCAAIHAFWNAGFFLIWLPVA